MQHAVVSQDEWAAARKALLAKEKEFTKLRDQLNAERRKLPWVKIDKDYVCDGPEGKQSLADLFDGRSELIVYHFMFHPDWDAGCKSYSFFADNFEGSVAHLAARDTTLIAVSLAPLDKLQSFRKRMGWTLKWVSSAANSFNRDFGVLFTPDEIKTGTADYNYKDVKLPVEDLPGISVFLKDAAGILFRTYSCYSRGTDMMNAAYHYLDLTPKGRDEGALSYTLAWLRLHDEYETAAKSCCHG
jgi:predicted dithiol-disulfide oxidoreductase (DUF899 family)